MTDKIIVKKERRFKLSLDFIIIFKFILVLLFALFFWLILYYDHLDIYIVEVKTKNESYLFSIMVSIMLILFLVACGFVISIHKSKWKILIFAIIIYIIYLGFTTIGFGFRFKTNFGLLVYENYESNTYKGVKFFVFNFVFWIVVFIVSLFFESEKE